jgi:hypothetical protein
MYSFAITKDVLLCTISYAGTVIYINTSCRMSYIQIELILSAELEQETSDDIIYTDVSQKRGLALASDVKLGIILACHICEWVNETSKYMGILKIIRICVTSFANSILLQKYIRMTRLNTLKHKKINSILFSSLF